MTRHAATAAARAAKLAEHQQKLPETERLVNRTLETEMIQRDISAIYTHIQDTETRSFVEMASNPNTGICATAQEAENFFRPHGTPFTTEIFRRYLEACAIARTGMIEKRLSVNSVRAIFLSLCGAARQADNPVPKEVVKDALNFIYGTLLAKGLVHHQRKEKRTPTSFDIAEFLSNLVDREFICQLLTTRDALLLLLFINLQIDSGSRGGELLRTHLPDYILDTHAAQLAEKEFRWKNVNLFVFPKQSGHGQNTLFARITFYQTKGRTRKQSGVKRIPLRSLPPHLAWGDSLLWLTILGIIDGAFAGITSWSDIENMRPDATGTPLFVKPTMQNVPVFRSAVKHHSSSNNKTQLISDAQMSTNQMGRLLQKLSQFCKLEHNILPSLLRRAAAFQLSKAVSQEERCTIMGHNPKDNVYWNHYRNETSTVDFQGLRYGLESEEVERMSSVFLATGTANPPTRISDAGMAKIYEDPALQQIFDELKMARTQLKEAYGTMQNAEKSDASGYSDFQQLHQEYKVRVATLKRATLRTETQDYWVKRHNGELYEDNVHAPAQSAGDCATTQPMEVIDVQDDADDDSLPIDPRLLLEDLRKNSTAIAEQKDEETRHANDDSSDDDFDTAGELDLNKDAKQSKTLTLPVLSSEKKLDKGKEKKDFDGVEMEPAAGRGKGSVVGIRQFQGQKSVQPFSLLDNAARLLFKQGNETSDPVTHKSIADYFVPNFNRLHRADLFYPGEEPLPGTLDCRYCGVDMRDLRAGQATHASVCHRKVLIEQQLTFLKERDSDAPKNCPFPKTRHNVSGDAGEIVDETPCSVDMEHSNFLWPHIRKFHVAVQEQAPTWSTENAYATIANPKRTAAAYGCLAHDEPLFLKSAFDFRMHLVIAHNVHSRVLKDDNRVHLSEDATTYFCTFCQGWICRAQHLQNDHMQRHLANDVSQLVSERGVFPATDTLGSRAGNRGIRCFCPFCLYDQDLDSNARLYTAITRRNLAQHIATHLARMRGVMPCPASRPTPEHLPICSQIEPLNSAQLTEHLRIAHNMDIVLSFLVVGIDSVRLIDSIENRHKNKTAKKRAIVAEEEDEDAAQGEDAPTKTPTKTGTTRTSVTAETKKTKRPAGMHQNGATKRDDGLKARRPLSDVGTNMQRMSTRASKRHNQDYREL